MAVLSLISISATKLENTNTTDNREEQKKRGERREKEGKRPVGNTWREKGGKEREGRREMVDQKRLHLDLLLQSSTQMPIHVLLLSLI